MNLQQLAQAQIEQGLMMQRFGMGLMAVAVLFAIASMIILFRASK